MLLKIYTTHSGELRSGHDTPWRDERMEFGRLQSNVQNDRMYMELGGGGINSCQGLSSECFLLIPFLPKSCKNAPKHQDIT